MPVAQWVGRRLREPGTYDLSRDSGFPLHGRPPRAARFDGKQRFSVRISTDPLGIQPPSITEFLRDTEGQQLLSVRATAGFLGRTRRAKLRFEPGFISAIERHLIAMGGAVPDREPPPRQIELLEGA